MREYLELWNAWAAESRTAWSRICTFYMKMSGSPAFWTSILLGRVSKLRRKRILRTRPNEGHTLILPKKHCFDLDEVYTEVAHAIMDASRVLVQTLKTIFQPDGIRACQDGGGFSDLNHYHIRYTGDHFVWGEPAQPHDAAQRLSQTKEEILRALSDSI